MSSANLDSVPETTYGFQKRLRFCLQAMTDHRPLAGRAPGGVRVLDLGCGTGELLAWPLARMGYDVVGLDPDEASIRRAREHGGAGRPPTFMHGTLDLLPAAQSFDVVVCSEVLEHVHDPGALLVSIRRRLRPDGLLVVTTPNGFGPFEWEVLLRDLARTVRARRDRAPRSPAPSTASAGARDSLASDCRHVNFFLSRELRTVITNAGFSVWRWRNRTALCGPYSDRLANALRRLGARDAFVALNARVADLLPPPLVSDWMVAAVCADGAEESNALWLGPLRRVWRGVKIRLQKAEA